MHPAAEKIRGKTLHVILKKFFIMSTSSLYTAYRLMLCDLRAKMKKTLIVITHDPHIAEMAERRFTIIDGVLSEVTVR